MSETQGDIDVCAKVDRRITEIDRDVRAKVAAEENARKAAAAEDLLRRVTRGEPDAMREFFEHAICQPNRITWEYSAARGWCAQVLRRHVRVPPPIDRMAFAICLHEAAHCIEGPCARTGDHRLTDTGCFECERLAWVRACSFGVRFAPDMFKRMRSALGTYTHLPTTQSAREKTGQSLGSVAWGRNHMRWELVDQWRDEADREARAKARMAARWTLVREWQK